MIYEFIIEETGEGVELELEPEAAPRIGEFLEVETPEGERVTVRRVPSLPAAVCIAPNLHVLGVSRPTGVPGADAYFDPKTKTYSPTDTTGEGVPCWSSRHAMQRTESMTKGDINFKQLEPGQRAH